MPIYDYQCSSCGHKAEVMRKVSAASVEACPQCAKETFAKQVSAPSFQLTGSGWYATDFKGGASKTAKPADSTTSESNSESSATPAACATGCACH
ncbi:zinc ribbon domain-containing protein [Methylotenera sp.]|jgi:putative FmdB family regulatory protein|uniref:FmdB family zinc ribbon protein n=1 Tax=Methylotenera sp. TaxID=2051956 RepID=UPI0027353A8A|nr:zinc ribbon domain-containing protein [Methylotenera sp.]MDP3777615.1 zinc ribbon domain-containing protein [Methylotenera sp.]